jgi:2,3-bisphosphoglycerate-dependent phosphoglycerate mutase
MKISCQIFCFAFIISLLSLIELNAQSNSSATTIILLRHAEKDTSTLSSGMMQADPPLSVKGVERSGKLLETLKSYHFDSIFSTNFNRTRNTVLPLATKFDLSLCLYDPKNQAAFAEKLLEMKGKTILVVGHSNTIPALVNLLIGSAKYANLADNEYDKIWILRVESGKYTETQIQY